MNYKITPTFNRPRLLVILRWTQQIRRKKKTLQEFLDSERFKTTIMNNSFVIRKKKHTKLEVLRDRSVEMSKMASLSPGMSHLAGHGGGGGGGGFYCIILCSSWAVGMSLRGDT